MRIFEIVKENINLREAAELYGIDVNRYGKALCPFHNDRHPSLYVAENFTHGFASFLGICRGPAHGGTALGWHSQPSLRRPCTCYAAIIHHFPLPCQPPPCFFLDKMPKPGPRFMAVLQKVCRKSGLSFTSPCSGATIGLAAGIVSDSKTNIPIPPVTPQTGRRGRNKGGIPRRALPVRQCGDLP